LGNHPQPGEWRPPTQVAQQEMQQPLEEVDQEFFSYPHDLTKLLFAYVSTHPEEFGALPKPDDA
jgi:hypothetical protein